MNRKEKNILLLLLLCAGLLVAMLYSPIGSPENYISSSAYGLNQGVSFSGGIQNSPKGKMHSNNSSIFSSSGIPNAASLPSSSLAITGSSLNGSSATPASVGSFETKRTANYAVAATTSESSLSSNTTYAVQNSASFSNEIKPNSGGGYGGGPGAAFSGRTSRNKSNVQYGFTALNVDMTVFNDLTTSQGGGYTPGSGATDPGEDPIGNPIPVSDGFWLLLLMAAGYCYFLFIKKKGSLKKVI